MGAHKSFFIFLGVLTLLTICFGVYVHDLKSCVEQAPLFPIVDCHKLYLAFGVLFAVAIMLSLGAAFYALVPPPATGDHPGKQIFDTLSKSLLPVVTLVLGYYFGSAQVASPPTPAGAGRSDPAASGPATAASAPAEAAQK